MSRPLRLVTVDTKTRPAVIMTREAVREMRGMITVAPITTTVRGLSSEVAVGQANGIDHDSVIAVDNITTVPASGMGRTVGFLSEEQERQLADAVAYAFDLDLW